MGNANSNNSVVNAGGRVIVHTNFHIFIGGEEGSHLVGLHEFDFRNRCLTGTPTISDFIFIVSLNRMM
jgi:hypothetical protein